MNETLETVWTKFAGRMAAFIRRRIGNAAAAEDILQDVFLKLHRGLGELKDGERIEGWLFRVARNAIADHYRRSRPTEALPDDLAADPPEDDGGMGSLKTAFRRMIDNLPEPYREAIVLTEFDGLTQQEMAARLGISVSGAKSRVQRAREKLKTMLLDCCRLEFDRRGQVIDCEPRSVGCDSCR